MRHIRTGNTNIPHPFVYRITRIKQPDPEGHMKLDGTIFTKTAIQRLLSESFKIIKYFGDKYPYNETPEFVMLRSSTEDLFRSYESMRDKNFVKVAGRTGKRYKQLNDSIYDFMKTCEISSPLLDIVTRGYSGNKLQI